MSAHPERNQSARPLDSPAHRTASTPTPGASAPSASAPKRKLATVTKPSRSLTPPTQASAKGGAASAKGKGSKQAAHGGVHPAPVAPKASTHTPASTRGTKVEKPTFSESYDRPRQAARNIPQLTARQQRILDFLEATIKARQIPPTIREIASEVGLSSPSSAQNQLHSLERLGLIERDPHSPRALRLTYLEDQQQPTTRIPMVGAIAAGSPILADEHITDHLELPDSLVGSGTLFALQVSGDSMQDAGILDGDTVVIRQQPKVEQGEICAALIDDAATLKYFRKTPSGIFLDPANEAYSPIELSPDDSNRILGKLVTVLRTY